MRVPVLALAICLTYQSVSTAQIPGLPASTKDELAGNLRAMLLKNLPSPLYESAPNWGHQAPAKRLTIYDSRFQIKKELKNDGRWRKIVVEAIRPADTLILDLRDIANPEQGRISFKLFASLDVLAHFQEQRWESGIKLLDFKARARARVRVLLNCEVAIRTEAVNLLPEIVLTIKVTKADLGYENLKFEHLAGVGGEAAELLGEAGHKLLSQWKPSLERDLLERGEAAIVKAGREKEVRIGLSKLLKRKD
ncbi:MAG: hypothetical protein U0746_12495 [Gemmataceae bacterium]